MTKPIHTVGPYTADIEQTSTAGAGIRFPETDDPAWQNCSSVPIIATLDGQEFRTKLAPDGRGGYLIRLKKGMRDQIGKGIGDSVQVTVMVDDAPREIPVPLDLIKALSEHPEVESRFNAMPPAHRNEYVNWINSAKKPVTRRARIEKAVERIRAGVRFS